MKRLTDIQMMGKTNELPIRAGNRSQENKLKKYRTIADAQLSADIKAVEDAKEKITQLIFHAESRPNYLCDYRELATQITSLLIGEKEAQSD